MRKPEDGKKVYDNIEIPEELNNVVKDAIHSMDKGKSIKKHRTHNAVRIFRYCGTAAAALLVCMTIGLNTNEVFAREETFVGDINQEIQTIVDDYVADAKQKFAEYKEAFFATGGTEEEWGNRDIAVNVDYEVKYQQGNILSMVLITDEAWVSAYGVRYYYNLDLSQNRQLTLQDLLGDNYVEIANESIIRQMKERDAADENAVYWGIGKAADDGMIDGFQTVDENTSFYINADGNPVVCFEKYEVAPGYMGFQEFEIQKPAK